LDAQEKPAYIVRCIENDSFCGGHATRERAKVDWDTNSAEEFASAFEALRRHAVPQHDGMLAGASNRQIVDVTAGVFALLQENKPPALPGRALAGDLPP
jgi:hypothetical protein